MTKNIAIVLLASASQLEGLVPLQEDTFRFLDEALAPVTE